MKQNVKHRMQIIERGFGFTDKVRRKYMIPLNAVPNSSVLLEVVYFEGILLSCSLFFHFQIRTLLLDVLCGTRT